MTLYITALNWDELSKKFKISRGYRYIDIDNLIKVNGLKLSREIHQFVLNQEIKRTFEKYIRYSYFPCKGIIYKNSNVCSETIEAIREFSNKIICLDHWENPLLERIFENCDEVIRI